MQLIFMLFFGLGLFLVALDFLQVPYLKTSKVIMSVANRTKRQTKKIDVIKDDMAMLISKLIRLNNYKKVELEEKIKTAGLNSTAEMFIANNLLKPILLFLLSILLFIINPFFGILIMLLSLLLYFRDMDKLNLLISKKRDAIEKDLNRFTSYIAKTIVHNKDVVTIIENFIKYAGPALKDELKITVADMKSGNQETALARLEARVNSTALSDITRGLISTIQGNSTTAYWATLSIKFSEFERQRLKRQAIKVPDKVSRCTMILVIEFVAVMMYMLVVQTMQSASVFG